MPNRFSQRIIRHISDSRYRPVAVRQLARELAIDAEDFDAFAQGVREMAEQGKVLLGQADAVALPSPGREMIGSFRANARGFGFIVPQNPLEHGDLFVPVGQTMGALTGDLVRARVYHQPRRAGGDRSPYTGQIVQIIQRAERKYVGNLDKRDDRWVVQADGQILSAPVVIRDPHAHNANAGDKVVVELLSYPDGDKPAQGVIVEVLGQGGEPDVETRAVQRAFGLAEKFPQEVLDAARAASATFDENAIPADRLDLTATFILTIDPPDAKDFDDALSLTKFDTPQDDGAVWELGVHIADVSHFVRPGTPLDVEAKARGNSTYLPRLVVPMLPELLSNGVCSLQEGVNRFTKTAFIRYDATGHVVGERFAQAVIRSAKRLTYLEAQALIDGDLKEAVKQARTEPKYPPALVPTLKQMDELAKLIRQRRLHQGMIVLGLPEVVLEFDASGRVVDAHPADDAFTHTLIEQFMVEANEAVARLFHRLEVPMIRRIHADPPTHDVSELRRFARVAGFNIPAQPNRKELQQLLDAVRDRPAQTAVHLAVLRTLSRAEYAPLIIGHFALASEHYTHFTSPIRRYPDLIVHRGLEAYLALAGTDAGKSRHKLAEALRRDPRLMDEQALTEMGTHCSDTERNSQAAESQLRTYLVLELLSTLLGQDFDGTVTGVTGGGVFIQLNHYLVDGFVRIDDLPSAGHDTWRLNRTTGALVAQRSGRAIAIGDRFTVRIAKVEPFARRLELVIIENRTGQKQAGGKSADGDDLRPKDHEGTHVAVRSAPPVMAPTAKPRAGKGKGQGSQGQGSQSQGKAKGKGRRGRSAGKPAQGRPSATGGAAGEASGGGGTSGGGGGGKKKFAPRRKRRGG